MDVLPSRQQHCLLSRHQPQSTTDLKPRHVGCPNQICAAVGPKQIDLGLSVAEHVNMGWQMIIGENDNP